jgi:hypothetical protein
VPAGFVKCVGSSFELLEYYSFSIQNQWSLLTYYYSTNNPSQRGNVMWTLKEKKTQKEQSKTARKEKMQRANQRQHKYCKITDSLILLTTYGRVSIFNLLTVREVRRIKQTNKQTNKQTKTKKSATNLKNA